MKFVELVSSERERYFVNTSYIITVHPNGNKSFVQLLMNDRVVKIYLDITYDEAKKLIG